ncbi:MULTISPECIES: fatty acid desaturase [unclassified Roseofilum]|uniref:fatty acid desaturase n=1 Tax=unclassified Roseofilum TaxID=2620099 RepID=UPI000E971E6E|nr:MULTISPECIES: fatty acid desaturase [unclassified Roseofilum]MBP0007204.1 fatty acid desaturase [Roseofilum sp. Belize Diploria]MBP0031847.1 fatty acid desaturase [Roseofilum sp. Belize BBD 4]HBQ98947.1 fatty acid desaturase [Cyanobacteria bacterium UBA11691]
MKTAIAHPSARLQTDEKIHLDSNIRLRDIINTLPREVFIKDSIKAWSGLIINLILVGLGWWGTAIAPWYCLPLLWLFTGSAFTGLFVIGHDCGHRSFANRKWINNLIGHLVFIPCIYPFHGWRIKHNIHHKYTNCLEIDNAWKAYSREEYNNFHPIEKWAYRGLRGKFWWLASAVHWAKLHFQWWTFAGKEREQVRFSALFVIAQMAIGFPLLIATTGLWGWVNYWLMPWLVFHFWMSTITLLHHTKTDIPFKPQSEWNEAEAQLMGTAHCQYPRWFEWMAHDINVHVPHHISTAIPWYNLRQAHASLEQNWGQYMTTNEFSLSSLWNITSVCHLYDEDKCYQPFTQKGKL